MSANNRSLAKSLEEIKKIEISSRILADVLSLLEKYVKPGVETLELDKIAEDYIRSKDAIPAFKGFPGEFSPFPGTLCISIDEQVVHGIPSNRKLEEGQIVTLDGGVLKDSYYADSAVTYGVGVISDEKKQLMKITEESLYLGIAQAIENNKVYDISRAIQSHCEKHGFSLTRELVGHGVGKKLHEEPAIPNFVPLLYQRKHYPNVKLESGMSMAIEPMVHLGKKEITIDKDGWTIKTADRKASAHYEHTIIVQKDKPLILTERK